MSDLETKREELELQLLEQEICLKRREVSWFGKFTVLIPALASTGALIAALVAYSVAKSTNSEQLVKISETKADYYAKKEEVQLLEDQIHEGRKTRNELEERIEQLKNGTSVLANLAQASIQGSSPLLPGPPIGLVMTVNGNTRSGYYIDVHTEPSATITTYHTCRGTFVFPIESPDFSKCTNMSDRNCKTTPCRVGPFGAALSHDLWVVAQFGAHQEIRYINLDSD